MMSPVKKFLLFFSFFYFIFNIEGNGKELKLNCYFDTQREIGKFEFKERKFWQKKESIGYTFNLENNKLTEVRYGKDTTRNSYLPDFKISIDPTEKDYIAREIRGTFSFIPNNNSKIKFSMIHTYEVRIGNDNEIFNSAGFLTDIKSLIHTTSQYRLSANEVMEWLKYSPSQSYSDFEKWKKDKRFVLNNGVIIGSCETMN